MALRRSRSYRLGNGPDLSRLTAYLLEREERRVTLTFGQLEREILPGLLPSGARAQPGWWSNIPNRRVRHNRAWLAAGWWVASVDQGKETVEFER